MAEAATPSSKSESMTPSVPANSGQYIDITQKTSLRMDLEMSGVLGGRRFLRSEQASK